MASYDPRITYACEICGLDSLNEDELRNHTREHHVDGKIACPFCGFSDESCNLTVHVNQAHLDFLTPDSELNMTFIDETSPSGAKNRNSADLYQNSFFAGPSSSEKSNKPKYNINNLNISTKINGGGKISPQSSTYGQGSPLRSSLGLKFKNSTTDLCCPLCTFTSLSPDEMQEHVNRKHFDLTSPCVSNSVEQTYSCPICVKNFNAPSDLELHVNIEHRDVLSPTCSPNQSSCPICGITLNGESNSAASRHVESHFVGNSLQSPDKGVHKQREQEEFELLQAQYGMDNQGNFREQFVSNMQKAVYAGEMSVADYYERTLDLRAAESCGIDDGSSVTKSIVPRVRAISSNASSVVRTLLCTCIDHFASSYGDKGWGCGYRNTQMLISSLLTHTGYNEKIYVLWQNEKPSRSSVPSISRLQSAIESAWSQGFDVQGSEQLGCRLVNTRKWIGATEVVTFLSHLYIKCQLVDFHRPTGSGGTHPELFRWVLRYFENGVGGEFTPPLYLQHQGHSRTIIGIEVHRNGNLVLLVLDPSHSPQQMAQFGDTSTAAASLRLLRKSESAMKAMQYQIVAVVGMIESEQEYQQSKVLRGLRIPQDR